MNSPRGNRLERGLAGGAQLTVPNGAKGTVVGADAGQSVIVVFDDLGGGVGVSVRMKWLEAHR